MPFSNIIEMGHIYSLFCAPQEQQRLSFVTPMPQSHDLSLCPPHNNISGVKGNPFLALPGVAFNIIFSHLDSADKKALRMVGRRARHMADNQTTTIQFQRLREHAMGDVLHSLGKYQRWEALETITFRGSDLSRELVTVFNQAAASGFPMLKHLEFSACRFNAEDFETLVSGEWNSRVTSLHFSKNWLLDSSGTNVGVLSHQQWPKLEELDLADNEFDSSIGVQLANLATKCPILRKLSLRGNRFGPEGFMAMAEGSWGTLTELDLAENRPGVDSTSILALARAMPCLETLDLLGNKVGPSGAEAIAQASPFWKLLRSLNLFGSELGDEGLDKLSYAHFPALEWLNLAVGSRGSNLRMGVCGASSLAEFSSNIPSLRFLSLACNDLCAETLGTILDGNWRSLEDLDLSYNQLSSRCMEVLAAKCPPSIKRLELVGTRIEGKEFSILLQRRNWEALEVISTDMDLDAQGARALALAAKSGCLSTLRELSFGMIALEDSWSAVNSSALKIMLSVPWKRLESLSFGESQVDGKAIQVLGEAASNGHLPMLRHLSIGFNTPKDLLKLIKGDKDGQRWANLRVLCVNALRVVPENYIANQIHQITRQYPFLKVKNCGITSHIL